MTGDEIRAMQRQHISDFLAGVDFTGRVLDYGCSHGPYRGIVEAAGGEWHGYNRDHYPGGSKDNIGPDNPLGEKWDVILCTQVLQYVPDPPWLLDDFRGSAPRLVLTYALNWPEVEPEDLWRFTSAGMEVMLRETGWEPVRHVQLGAVPFGEREWCALGYGVVAE